MRAVREILSGAFCVSIIIIIIAQERTDGPLRLCKRGERGDGRVQKDGTGVIYLGVYRRWHCGRQSADLI